MRKVKKFSVVCAAGLTVMLGTAACGGDSDDETTTTVAPASTTTVAVAAPKTIGTCEIKPRTVCEGANLAGANLVAADLTGANLTKANLTGADLAGANLTDANLTDANLTTAVLKNATVVNTNLSNANLTQTNFKGAKIENLNDTGATQCETIRTDGTVNNASCPPASTVTTSRATTSTRAPSTTQATATTRAGETTSTTSAIQPLTLPCKGHPELFLTVYKSQADNTPFDVPENLVSKTEAVGEPSCATGWASQSVQDTATTRKAIFHASDKGWQLASVTGCPGTNVPEADKAGIC